MHASLLFASCLPFSPRFNSTRAIAFPGVQDGKGASPEPCSGSTAHIPQFREEVNVELNLRSWIEILDTVVLRHHSLALHPRVFNPSVTNPPKEDTWHHNRKCLPRAGGRQLDPHNLWMTRTSPNSPNKMFLTPSSINQKSNTRRP